MDTFYCGVDAGSSQCHVTMLDEVGSVQVDADIHTSELQLTAFFESMQKSGQKVKVHLEAAELAGWIRQIILGRTDIDNVTVSDAKQLSWISKDPRKNDSIDAFKLAEFMRLGRTHPVYYSDDEKINLLRKQEKHYDGLTREKTRIKNKIKAYLRTEGIIIKSYLAFSKRKRRDILNWVKDSMVRESLADMYWFLDKNEELCKKSEKRLEKLSANWPVIQYFMEVPGIGLILACRFVAYIQTPWRFSTKEKLWSYCKLGLIQRNSDGKPLSSPRLDKNGNGALKDLSRKAFENAQSCKDNNAFKRAYHRYLKTTHNKEHARLSVQRKILTVLWTMWRKNERYDDRRG